MPHAMKKIQEWQALIGGISVMLGLFAASGVVLKFTFALAKASNQHEQIIHTQSQIQQNQDAMMRVLIEKCK